MELLALPLQYLDMTVSSTSTETFLFKYSTRPQSGRFKCYSALVMGFNVMFGHNVLISLGSTKSGHLSKKFSANFCG
jgi:hypothetical protein